jgi:transcription-repair coupling factor (superfamily II helicase)
MEKAISIFKNKINPLFEKKGGAKFFSVKNLTGSADAFLSIALTEKSNSVLVMTPGIPDAERLLNDIEILAKEGNNIEAAYFPALLDNEPNAMGLRIKLARELQLQSDSPKKRIIVAPFTALTQAIPLNISPVLELHIGKSAFKNIAQTLINANYERKTSVEKEGDFSIRGGIVDIWSPGEELPIRAEFFGEEVESLRTFSAASQLSIDKIESASFFPLADSKCENTSSKHLTDILPSHCIIIQLNHNTYSFDSTNFTTFFSGEPLKENASPIKLETSSLPGFSELGANQAHHPELFEEAKARLERHLKTCQERKIHIAKIDNLSGGFETDGLIVVTKSDRVFTKKQNFSRRKKADLNIGERLNDFEEIEYGQYVVHVDYGIGRFIGSSEITIGDKRTEVFTIEYADEAKLHVPSTHAHLLSRYIGVKGESVKLHSLDGKRWAKDKKNAEKAVADLAAALLQTQAEREIAPGFAYDIECDGIDAFEAAFPYQETPDQKDAIEKVKLDMASQKPMDRLVCGDAGYGKTEVAMRAAFIAAMNGKQTAVLAPTTVLAEQHFETFTSRFDGTPIRIESVSRFQGDKTHKGTFSRLATGACDIVIGTHAILSPKIQFRDLGLIIIDEEQRFGVVHKEFLKNLRTSADIITLSATPIPRTLYLSMTGARDLSLIRTAPFERVAVETNIANDSDEIIRAAIMRELQRNGQVFFLHNRISTISAMESRIKKLVPNATVTVAHGQMDAKLLATKMQDFSNGKYDILLSTTIIESGIDIPRANTIIIDRADMFGIADLYQLRGRVGRSSRQGYAYFLLPTDRPTDSDTRERLDTLRRNTRLGSGFNIALKDLEFRGAGNLLGAKQSGHIAAVGFGLYCKLLKRTVQLLKGEKVSDLVDVKFNIDFISFSAASEMDDESATLPYDYIEDDAQRIAYMKRLALASEQKEIANTTKELIDRFGPLPKRAKRLIELSRLKIICAQKGIGHLDVKDLRAVFYWAHKREILKVAHLKKSNTDSLISQLIAAAKQLPN